MKRRLLLSVEMVGLLCMLIMLTGCWSRKEMNNIAIVVAMGLDKKGDDIVVSLQIVNPTEIALKNAGQGAGTPVTTYQGRGATVLETLRRVTAVVPRKIYLSHLRVLVISEELAHEGVNQVLDVISRNYQLRTDFYLVVSKGAEANQVLKILTPIERIPANKLYSTLEFSQKEWAPTAKVRLDELISNLKLEGKEPVLTGIRIVGNEAVGQTRINVQRAEPPTKLVYSGLAVFKQDKLVGWLNESESKGYSYITDDVDKTVGTLDCPDETGQIAVQVIRSKTKMKGEIDNGQPRIHLNLIMEQDIGEVRCRQLELTKPDTLKQLESQGADRARDIINQSVRKAKAYRSDIFGFGEAIHRADPAGWNKLKKDWEQQFRNLPVDVQVKVNIRRLGTVIDSYIQKKEE